MAKGMLCIDKNGAIQMRVGANTAIIPVTAMCRWYDYLVLGCGSADGDQANLVRLDKTRYQDSGDIVDGSAENDDIASEFRTKMEDDGTPNIAKRLEAVTVVYYDNTAWNSMTMTLAYRFVRNVATVDTAGGVSSTTGWTTISPAAITLDVQSGVTYKTLNVGSDPGMAFQVRVTTNGFFEILGFILHLEYGTERQF
jgi:hypothetical protein